MRAGNYSRLVCAQRYLRGALNEIEHVEPAIDGGTLAHLRLALYAIEEATETARELLNKNMADSGYTTTETVK